MISFSCQGSTPGSERTSGWLVDSSAGDFAATRCGLSRNAKKPTTAAKPSARAIAAMPNFKKGSPAIRRLISRTLKLHRQTRYPLERPVQQDEPASDQTPKHPSHFPDPLANANAAILHTPKTRTPHPHPNRTPANNESHRVRRTITLPTATADRAPHPSFPRKRESMRRAVRKT